MRTVQQIEAEMAEGRAQMKAQLKAGIPFAQCKKGKPGLYDEWLAAKEIEQKHYSATCRAIDNGRSN